MEMIMNLPIEELRSETRYNVISTVYAHLVEPVVNERFAGYTKKVEHFSSFSNHYKSQNEREFIAELIEKNPGKYNKFTIVWNDSN